MTENMQNFVFFVLFTTFINFFIQKHSILNNIWINNKTTTMSLLWLFVNFILNFDYIFLFSFIHVTTNVAIKKKLIITKDIVYKTNKKKNITNIIILIQVILSSFHNFCDFWSGRQDRVFCIFLLLKTEYFFFVNLTSVKTHWININNKKINNLLNLLKCLFV